MTQAPERVFTTREFDGWWNVHGLPRAVRAGVDAEAARALAWAAWRAGREQFSEATAHQRLQPVRR
jgi:hypothetical protein